jgi:hypothetical protein
MTQRTSVLLLVWVPVVASAQTVLFEDDFQRPLGPAWVEYRSRGQAPQAGDTPFAAQAGTLRWSATGAGAYVEDFIATAQSFPVEGSRVEFDLRAVTGTRQGYVGPGFLWVDDPLRKRGAFNLDGPGPAWLGAGLFYRWENQGTGGALLYAGAPSPAWQDVDRKVPGVNTGRFAHHAITVSGGQVTWEADGAVIARAALAQPLEAGARRRFVITTRLYDSGLAQSLEVKNLRILGAAGTGPVATPQPRGGDPFVEADEPPERARALVALAFPGPTLVIEAANSAHDIAWDRAHWRIAIRGQGPGTFPAAVSFNLAPGRGWVSTSPCSATLTRVDGAGGQVEGRFDCLLQGFDGERAGSEVRSRGAFRAEVQP